MSDRSISVQKMVVTDQVLGQACSIKCCRASRCGTLNDRLMCKCNGKTKKRPPRMPLCIASWRNVVHHGGRGRIKLQERFSSNHLHVNSKSKGIIETQDKKKETPRQKQY